MQRIRLESHELSELRQALDDQRRAESATQAAAQNLALALRLIEARTGKLPVGEHILDGEGCLVIIPPSPQV